MINLRKKIHHNIILALLLIFSLQIVEANLNNPVTKAQYQMTFKANLIMCNAKLNGVYLFDTENAQRGIPELISLMQPVTPLMNEGKNTLTVDALNFGHYLEPGDDGYCDVTIVAMVQNPNSGKIESKPVSNIRFTYKKREDGDDSQYPYPLSVEKSDFTLAEELTSHNIAIEELTPLKDGNNFDIQNLVASREIYVNHPHPFRWIHNSTPFEDTVANRQLLWEKYNEIRNAIVKKDKAAIRRIMDMGATDMAHFQGNDNVDSYFNIIFSQILDEYFTLDTSVWKSEPLTMDDYNLEIYADGKLFRFNEKRKILTSPLRWRNVYSRNVLRYNPIFTYVNGKIEVALF